MTQACTENEKKKLTQVSKTCDESNVAALKMLVQHRNDLVELR